MGKPSKFSPEVQERTVKMILEPAAGATHRPK